MEPPSNHIHNRTAAMSNASISAFCSIHHKAAILLPRRRKVQRQLFRNFSTLVSPKISSESHFFNRPSSLVLNACLSPSDAPQLSDDWFALRKDKLTTSTFSRALGMLKSNHRYELWHEKVFALDTRSLDVSSAMKWGLLNEAKAIEQYKNITGREVSSLGFAIHSKQQYNWLGASPDGLLGCFSGGGILEVKCPFNNGKPEFGSPWSTMPFYYMPQVQGQMEIMDRDWVDLYCWTLNGSTIFRVNRDRDYWQLIHGVLREFWWENVVPAREDLHLGRENEARSYRPTPKHKMTRFVILRSKKLAGEAKLLCREVAGHVEICG